MEKKTKKKKNRTLKDYVKFLKENHLEDFVRMQMEMIYKEDIPLLKFVPEATFEQRIENSKISIVRDCFDPIISGNTLGDIKERMKVWEEDKLAFNISQTSITAIDVVIIYAVQQKSMLHFLPEFTSDVNELMAINNEIHDYYTDLRKIVFQTYTKVQKITERKIKESEENFRLITENVKEYAIIKLDPDGNIVTWNQGAEKIKGYSANEVIGKHYSIFFTKEQIQSKDPQRNLKSAIRNGRFETQAWRLRKDGSRFCSDVVITPIYDGEGNLKGFTKITKDITDRKKDEEKIKKALEQLEQAQELAHLGSWEVDLLTNEITWSDELYRIYGLKPGDQQVKLGEFMKYNHDDDIDYVAGIMNRAVENKKPFTFDYRIINAKGYLRVLHTHGEVYADKKGKAIKMAGTVQDITERKIAEEQIIKTVKQLNEAQHMAHIGSWEYDVKTKKRTWSDEMFRIYGFERKEVKWDLEEFRKFTVDEDKDVHKEVHDAIFKEKEPFSYDYRINTRKGELRYLQVKGIVITDDKGEPVKITGTTQDITEQKLADEKIKESRERFKLLVNAQSEMGEGVSITEGSRFVYVNEALCKMYGYTEEELLSMPSYFDMIPPSERERLMEKTKKRIEGEKVEEGDETSIMRKDGSIIQIEYSRKLINSGIPNHFVSIIRDITERKKEEEKMDKMNKELSEAQRLAHLGNWEWDIKTDVVSWSDELYNIFGIKKEEIGNGYKGYLLNVHPDDKDMVKQILSKARKDKKPFVIDYRILHTNGHIRNVNARGVVLTDANNNAIKIAGTVQDTTEMIKVKKDLEVAQEMVKAKQQFLANMSHEIRTPMNVIIGFTKVILKTDLTAKQKEYLEGIKISGETLLVLINDILDLAKVDAGKMVFENIPFKLTSSINAILHLFEGKIFEKNLNLIKEFDANLPNVIVGDPVRLHQIILNLISNAVKFTHEGQITISAHLLEEDDEEATIEFSVSDTGIGIEPEQQKIIFEKFQQASSSTARLFGGTGLGLAIVKQLVEAQNGIVKLKSERGKGSEFSFIITFKKGELKEEIEVFEQELSESEIMSKNILVVEDMPFNQLLIKTLLNEMGFKYDLAENGLVAVNKLKENNKYDLILMDMQMPEMNGIEATNYIRNMMSPPVSQIPIIALTADVASISLERCKELGMNDYISKPINEKLLYKKIVSLFIRPQNQDNNQTKTVNLNYLKEYTRGDKAVMAELIRLYLEQTQPVLQRMKQSVDNKDWDELYQAMHKLLPSFSIIGMHPDHENTAKKIQDYTRKKENLDELPAMVSKIEAVCLQACEELEKLSLEI